MKLKQFSKPMAATQNILPWSNTIEDGADIVTAALDTAIAKGTSFRIIWPPNFTSQVVDAITLRAISQQPRPAAHTLHTNVTSPNANYQVIPRGRTTPSDSIHSGANSALLMPLPDTIPIKRPFSPQYEPTFPMDSEADPSLLPTPANFKKQRPAV